MTKRQIRAGLRRSFLGLTTARLRRLNEHLDLNHPVFCGPGSNQSNGYTKDGAG